MSKAPAPVITAAETNTIAFDGRKQHKSTPAPKASAQVPTNLLLHITSNHAFRFQYMRASAFCYSRFH